MSKIIYPYIRFSSDKQAAGSSFQRQMERITDYANENGYIVNNSLKLQDLGLSAFTAKHIEKGALGAFLDGVKAGKIEQDGSAYLCIEQLDRLSRENVDDAYQVFRKILKSNVNIITLMDNKIYTKESLTDLMSIMYSLMLMAQANQESAKKSDRVLRAFDKKLDKLNEGKTVQYVGMFPGWIDNKGTKEETNFVINKKSEIVQRVFSLYINGTSMGDIARIFNEERVPQVAKKRQKNYTNSWSSAKINHLLKNRCVLGELLIRKTGDIFENYYPAIISVDDWDVVQSMMKNKKIAKSSGRRSINIFTGKMFCACCGQKYYFETDDKNTKTGKKLYYMLKCSGRRSLSCKSKSIKYDDFLDSSPNLFGMITKSKKDNSKEIDKIKLKIKEINETTKKSRDKLITLENLNDSNELDFTVYLKESSKVQKQVRENDARIASFKLKISRLSSDNKLDYFDKTDPNSVVKAKKFISDNFAAFVISSDSRFCIALYNDGQVLQFKIKNSKIEKKESQVKNIDNFESFNEFYKLKEQVLETYKNGTMDGKFIEILSATNFWGVETSEKDYSLD
ncbi:TPA: recombinase family protein [Vibrio parahaemolyticus]|nr:recombinase family protein [Vibrio parahaemolyticus]HAV1451857.1 recombinase family protein [Vibrio parahaemolyticus]HBN6287296.1 recombinase family protein [Vibrio parahaemolyticus]